MAMFQFLIHYPHIIIASIWVFFTLVLAFVYFHPRFGAHVTRMPFVAIAITLHIGYAVFLSWGQYVVWSENEFTKVFLNHSLSPDVALPFSLVWMEPVFDGSMGYFWFYVLSHFFAPVLYVFFVTFFIGGLLLIYKHYHPLRFKEGDVAIIVATLMIAGWPGVLAFVPIALLGAVCWSYIAKRYFHIDRVYLPPAFVVFSLPMLFVGDGILNMLKSLIS